MKRVIIKILCTLSLLALLGGCSKVSDEDLRAAHAAANNGAIIIDVRTPEEFSTKHISNAINIPVEKIDKLYALIPQNKEIIVYCRSGSRSHVAANYLKQKGRIVYDVATQGEWEREIPAVTKGN